MSAIIAKEEVYRNEHGHASKEYCEKKLAESQARVDALQEEYHANRLLIKNRVQGRIRAAQSRNKEIKDEIRTEIACQAPWRNGGVW